MTDGGFEQNRIAVDAIRLSCSYRAERDVRQEGTNSSGTLSPFYQELYDEYKNYEYYDEYTEQRVKKNHARECERTNRDSTIAWIATKKERYQFPVGECTSWVQFRLRKTVVPDFDNGYLHEEYGGTGGAWGNASEWERNADVAGVLYFSGRDNYYAPQKYSIAQWDVSVSSSYGHVAFVEAVSNDGQTIWVSEMNWRGSKVCYLSVRKLTKNRSTEPWPVHFIQFE